MRFRRGFAGEMCREDGGGLFMGLGLRFRRV